MRPPDYFKNPFVETTELYRAFDIYQRINLNMLYIVPINRIFIRTKPHVKKLRVVAADYRYPGILYKSKLDPLNTTVKEEFCIFDGTHRVHKMLMDGKTAGAFFIIEPKVFEGLKYIGAKTTNAWRTTGCIGCME